MVGTVTCPEGLPRGLRSTSSSQSNTGSLLRLFDYSLWDFEQRWVPVVSHGKYGTGPQVRHVRVENEVVLSGPTTVWTTLLGSHVDPLFKSDEKNFGTMSFTPELTSRSPTGPSKSFRPTVQGRVLMTQSWV